jgi:MFS family permease
VFRAERLPYLGATIVALLFFSQALRLEDYGPFGPGAGLFPQIATGIALALAVTLLLVPALGHEPPSAEPEEVPAPEELRTFRLYMAGLLVMVVGAAWCGFLLSCVMLTMLLTWFAERRPWQHALVFGLVCGLIGTVGLGHFLEIELPYGAVDSWARQLVR